MNKRLAQTADLLTTKWTWWGDSDVIKFWRYHIHPATRTQVALHSPIRTVGRQDSSRGIG